jgi:hypothetical protein
VSACTGWPRSRSALEIAARKFAAIVPWNFIRFAFEGEPRLAKGLAVIGGNLLG